VRRSDTEVITRNRRRPEALAFLVEAAGANVGRCFSLEGTVADIGRDERNHVVIDDRRMSHFHARLRRDGEGRFTVEDRGSTNGTRLNGEILTQPSPMRDNDEIEVGDTTLVFKLVRLRSRRRRGSAGRQFG
jgi:pSer/pThr/pTyr-binding forkhead associated (FHA) protein